MDETESEPLFYKINIKDYNEYTNNELNRTKGFLNNKTICYIDDNENNIDDNLNNQNFIDNDDNKYTFSSNVNNLFNILKKTNKNYENYNELKQQTDIYINSADFTDNEHFIKYKEFIENKSRHPEQGGKRRRRKTSKKIHKTKSIVGGRRRRHRTSKKHAK